MAQMQAMQRQMDEVQAQIDEMEAMPTSGGGAVTVTVTGKKELMKDIQIQPEVVDPDDVEMLQDLILTATNEALRQMEEISCRNEQANGGTGYSGIVMRYYAKPLNKLINELSKLPGIGGKTRPEAGFSYSLNGGQDAMALADAISDAKQNMTYCSVCGNLTDRDPCAICSEGERDNSLICVVESPGDVVAMEKIREYRVYYHVLHGAISPMDGNRSGRHKSEDTNRAAS